MTVIAPQSRTRFTPEDSLNLKDERLYELVDGRLVEKQMSSLASRTAVVIIRRLGEFVNPPTGGEVYNEQSFQCFPRDPDLVRRPDIAFIAADRAAQVPEEGHVTIPPDLAVEIISPTNSYYEVDDKLKEYRDAHIKLVWVVNPKHRMIRVYGLGRSVVELSESDTLDGGDVLPGFSIPVKDLLPPPTARAGTP